ncbi:hypothetical protein [Mesorhizobium sp. CA7]|nr:hypothetical protein [Mesorhizobium sp. CA7]MBZ9815048.1 hypothetical protein [Mesorhizobium sp. CA7]
MLRLLAAIGAAVLLYKLGREVGRVEGQLFPLPPVDYERRRLRSLDYEEL